MGAEITRQDLITDINKLIDESNLYPIEIIGVLETVKFKRQQAAWGML